MKISFEDFSEMIFRRGVLIGESVIREIYDELKYRLRATTKPTPRPEADKPTNTFITAYCDAFRVRYGTNPVINGRASGTAKRIVKDVGLERALLLVETYLGMDEYYFKLKRHDLQTLDSNLNAVGVKAATGKSLSRNQALQEENHDANTQAMREYIQGKSND